MFLNRKSEIFRLKIKTMSKEEVEDLLSDNNKIQIVAENYIIKTPEIAPSPKVEVNIVKETVTGKLLPFDFGGDRDKSHEVEVARYTVPFIGESEIFKTIPSNGAMPIRGSISGQKLVLDIRSINGTIIIRINGNPKVEEELKNEFLKTLSDIRSKLGQLEEEVQKYNNSIGDRLKTELNARKSVFETEKNINPFSNS